MSNDKLSMQKGMMSVNSFMEKEKIEKTHLMNTDYKQNAYSSVKKYSSMIILFIFGLILVSAVKNETRSLQKEINNLEASIDVVKFNLDQEILDNEVITSPENISYLAKEYLNNELVFYEKAQIIKLNEENKKYTKLEKEEINKESEKKLSASIKNHVAQKIQQKKIEINKLQKLYESPEQIPKEIKTRVGISINKKKFELKNLYNAPQDYLTLERVGKWSAVQVVKLFLGMPVVPGR